MKDEDRSHQEVLKDCVRAIAITHLKKSRGGYPSAENPERDETFSAAKIVGSMMWGSIGVTAAQNKLRDCLDPTRPHKLSIEEHMWILREAKTCGYHDGMNYFCSDIGYSIPTPIEPQDDRAELQKKFIAMGADMKLMFEKLEKAT